jgi:5-methylcytosine-specific restriction endonuclease McrA
MADAIVAHATIISRAEARAAGLQTFFTGKPCKHGHIDLRRTSNGACRTCVNARNAAWLKDNPDSRLKAQKTYRDANADARAAHKREWYANNRDGQLDYAKRYRLANLEAARERCSRFYKENPDYVRAARNKRRARKLAAGGRHTAADIKRLYGRQRGKCANCAASLRSGYHADHITPLARGGSNDILNIQLLCPSCNTRKHAKDPLVWARQNGRLL